MFYNGSFHIFLNVGYKKEYNNIQIILSSFYENALHLIENKHLATHDIDRLIFIV